jgi:hypothetical protein
MLGRLAGALHIQYHRIILDTMNFYYIAAKKINPTALFIGTAPMCF